MSDVFQQRYIPNIRFLNGASQIDESNASTGNITDDETTDWVPLGPGGYNEITIQPNFSTISTANGSDEIDFYLQTTMNISQGVAYDLLNIHFANADNGGTHRQPRLWRGGDIGGVRALAVTDGTITDNETQVGVPLGTHVRTKIKFTKGSAPTLAYNCPIIVRNNPQGLALPIGKGINDNGVTTDIKRASFEHAATNGALAIVTGVASKKIRVIGLQFYTDVVGNITVQDDNGTPVKLTGAMEFIAGGSFSYHGEGRYPGERFLGETTAGDDLDIDVETSGTHSGYVEYLEI